MKFNINQKVRVKLTNFGRAQLEENHNLLYANFRTKYILPVEDAEGWSEWELWELMEQLGKYCYNGARNIPFETIIEIPENNNV